jgi:hypothetical protein
VTGPLSRGVAQPASLAPHSPALARPGLGKAQRLFFVERGGWGSPSAIFLLLGQTHSLSARRRPRSSCLAHRRYKPIVSWQRAEAILSPRGRCTHTHTHTHTHLSLSHSYAHTHTHPRSPCSHSLAPAHTCPSSHARTPFPLHAHQPPAFALLPHARHAHRHLRAPPPLRRLAPRCFWLSPARQGPEGATTGSSGPLSSSKISVACWSSCRSCCSARCSARLEHPNPVPVVWEISLEGEEKKKFHESTSFIIFEQGHPLRKTTAD